MAKGLSVKPKLVAAGVKNVVKTAHAPPKGIS